MSFQDHFDKNLRCGLLRLLEEAPGFMANTSVLHSTAIAFGFAVSRDVVEGQVAWLKEQGLITVEELGRVTVAKITARGVDVAKGLATHPGVQRPAPGA